jgi:iron complex outermembrane receptor protein
MKYRTMRGPTLKLIVEGLAFAGLAAWSAAAYSQSTSPGAPAASRSEPDTSLQEIIVTAEKRSTSMQDTPIAMDAFGGEDIRRSAISDISGLTRIAPDLQMLQTDRTLQLSIRGVTSLDVSSSSDPALTVNLDGEYINSGTAINAALFDLERVEVLRGPQGTLYGRNSTAGALNLIAAKPVLSEYDGYVTAGYGNFAAKHGEAAFNVPIGDKVAIRLSFFHDDHAGYRDNHPAIDGDNANTSAARISVLAKPNDQLTAYLAGEFVDVDQGQIAQYGVAVNGSTPGLVPYTNPDNPAQTSLIPSQSTFAYDPSRFPLATNGSFQSRQYALRGRLDYDFGPATLTYVGGIRYIRSGEVQEYDGLAPGGGVHYLADDPNMDSHTQSHELRLSSSPSSPLIWQTGVFFFRETQSVVQSLYATNFQIPPFPATGQYVNTFYRPDLKDTSPAVFGQMTVPVIDDTLSVTAGVRYTSDKKSGTFYNCPFNFMNYLIGNVTALPGTNCAGVVVTPQSFSGSKVTWSTGIDWHPATGHLVYGKVSSGYKAGGFDNAGTFSPESLLAYEVGSKNEFLNRTLQFNTSAFYYDYTNQQVQVFINPAIAFTTQNAGASRIYGLETDTQFQVTSADRLSLTANYLNAKFTKYEGSYGTLSGTAFPADLADHQPPLAPRFVFSFGYDRTFNLGDSGTLIADGAVRYTTSYFLSVDNWDSDRQAGYSRTELGLEYNSPNKSFSVRGFVHNLEDKIVKTRAAYINPPSEYVFEFGEPRTYGVQLTKKF